MRVAVPELLGIELNLYFFDFSRQAGCIQSGGISTLVDFLLRL